ncbi:MAG: hypothetical protein LBJ62_03150 [Bifidobacteriaceae bacterium]|nr:hypothetical protein [Bifidobacteriaceae bacterium]
MNAPTVSPLAARPPAPTFGATSSATSSTAKIAGRVSAVQIKSAAAYLALLAVTTVIAAQSAMAPWSEFTPKTADQGIFFYEGQLLLEGDAPYVDFFDHKGPLIFLVNALGGVLGGRIGVWPIEILALFFAGMACLRALAPIFGRWPGFLAAASLLIICGKYLEEGNMTEEYCLPLAVIAFAVLARFATSRRISRSSSLIMGLTGTGAFLFRPTELILWAVFCLAILIVLLRQRRSREALAATGWFLIGSLVVALPTAVWLVSKGALAAGFEQMILFNAGYSGRRGLVNAIVTAGQFLNGYDIYLAVTATAGLALWLRLGRGCPKLPRSGLIWLAIVNLIAMPVMFAIIVWPGRFYPHYMMQFLPLYVLPLGAVWYAIIRLIRRRTLLTATASGLAVLGLVLAVLWPGFQASRTWAASVSAGSTPPAFDQLVDVIRQNTTPDQPIQVGGSQSWIYLEADRRAPTRYHYIPFIGRGWEELRAEGMGAISDAEPKVVVDVGEVLLYGGFDFSPYDMVFSTQAQYPTMFMFEVYVRHEP